MRRAVPLLIAVLLAGCSGNEAGAPVEGPAIGSTTFVPLNATQAQLGFTAPESEQMVSQQLTIAPGETCFFFGDALPCSSRRTVDLTPMIPVDTPVQLAVSIEDDAGPGAFLDWGLQTEGATLTSYDDEGDDDSGQAVFVLVMQAGGSVGVEIVQYSTAVPPAETHVVVEAIAVVRPTVVPTFLPVSVQLAPGETLLAAGDGLEDFVVIPPGGTAVHHLGPFSYNATASGRHIVVALGQGDVKLFGKPDTPLRALLLQEAQGEPRPVTLGQDTTWEFQVEGVPLYVGLIVETADNAGFFGVGSLHGNYHVTMERLGAVVLDVSEDDCAVFIQCGFNPIGSSSSWYIGEYLDEKLGPGTYQVTASFEPSNNMQVRETYAYVIA